MKVSELKALIAEKNIKIADLAEAIGMDQSTYFRKIQNEGSGFTLEQIIKMVDYLGMTKEQATNIFLT